MRNKLGLSVLSLEDGPKGKMSQHHISTSSTPQQHTRKRKKRGQILIRVVLTVSGLLFSFSFGPPVAL